MVQARRQSGGVGGWGGGGALWRRRARDERGAAQGLSAS